MYMLDELAHALVSVLRISWQAAWLALLVVAIQWLLRGRLSAGWRFAFWSVVLIRLMLPVSVPSSLSLFNVVPAGRSALVRDERREGAPGLQDVVGHAPSLGVTSVERGEPVFFAPAPVNSLEPVAPKPRGTTLWPALALAWLAGVGFLGLRLAVGNFRFARSLRRAPRIADERVLAVLEECRQVMRLRRAPELIATVAVDGPALFGLMRPSLLLPPRLTADFSRRELRQVFLHELAHVRRGDLLWDWIATAAQTLHWFNPVLWFAFRRARADRELACDALALSRGSTTDSQIYGETIIKLLEVCSERPRQTGLVGILEDRGQMNRRIARIAGFRSPTVWATTALVPLLLLGCVGLTEPQRGSPRTTQTPPLQVVTEMLARNVELPVPLTTTVIAFKAADPSKPGDADRIVTLDVNGDPAGPAQAQAIVRNIAGTSGASYISVRIALMSSQPDFITRLNLKNQQLIAAVGEMLGRLTMNNLDQPGVQAILRRQLLAELNNILGAGSVQDVLLTSFAMQR